MRTRLLTTLLAGGALFACGVAQAQWTERVQVKHAAFAVPDAPSALVHAGPEFDPSRPLHLVVYLHGYMGCAEVLMNPGSVACKAGMPELTGWNLAAAHDAAKVDTLFVVPQLAFMKRHGKPGCFGRSECFRAFLSEVLAALPSTRLGGKKTLDDVATVTLVAHSAGYRAASAILQWGGVQALVHDVVLFDALYGKRDDFMAWVASSRDPPKRLLSLHTGAGSPARESFLLLRAAKRRFGADKVGKLDEELQTESFGQALDDKRVVIAHARVPHRQVPEAYLARVLRALEAK